MSKEVKKETEISTVTPKSAKKHDFSAIMGIGRLLVILSITYSAVLIVLGTKDIIALGMIVPMVLFALVSTIKQFIK